MQITIQNFRGIKDASFPLERIALVAAPNAAGKSAIAQAAGAVLSGQPMPIAGLPKMLAAVMVRQGQAKGFAELACDDSNARVDWPRAAFKTKGAPPQISAIAAGIELLTPHHGSPDDSTKQKRRAELLIEILNAHPTFEHLRERFSREGIAEETARAVWETVQKQGWAAAHAQSKETGARLKGQWEAVTGENFGSKKAEAYTPNEWEPELAGASDDALQAAVTDARDALEGMIAVSAIDDAERERLQALADSIEERQAAHDASTAEELEAAKVSRETAEALRNLRNPQAVQVQECPHCKGALSITGGKICEGSKITEAEINAWNSAADAARESQEELGAKRAAVNTTSQALNESKDAAGKLSKLTQGNASQDQINAAREALRVAQSRHAAFGKKMRADRLLASIIQNTWISAVLDTSGVRQEVVCEYISNFLTNVVAPLSAEARWHELEISADMSLHYGGRAWAVLSESERYRVRTLLQLAIARLQNSAAVIVDAADILDKDGRNDLFRMLLRAQMPAIVCMTFPAPTVVPDLQAAGIGASYWIADGELKPLAQGE